MLPSHEMLTGSIMTCVMVMSDEISHIHYCYNPLSLLTISGINSDVFCLCHHFSNRIYTIHMLFSILLTVTLMLSGTSPSEHCLVVFSIIFSEAVEVYTTASDTVSILLRVIVVVPSVPLAPTVAVPPKLKLFPLLFCHNKNPVRL